MPSTKKSKPEAPSPVGYRMPAEWEPHASTWLAWPHQASDWPGRMAPIPWVYGEIVKHLSRVEHVNILANSKPKEEAAKKMLIKFGVDLEQVTFWQWPTDRVWTRDSGPTFVVDGKGQKALVNWKFNAWAKYDNHLSDAAIPGRIARATKLPFWQPMFRGQRVVLEGGSIDVNGEGLLMTTEECLLSSVQARNPGMTQTDYEKVFAEYLGIEKVLWLGRGIAGDDTHGHIDDIARFVGPRRIVTVVEDNEDDDNYAPLRANLERLHGITDADGGNFDVIPLPMPSPIIFHKQRLPASYANFYIANGLVLVPTFNDENDRYALGILGEVFPDHKVIGIHCGDFVYGLGTLHCMTQQEPK
ncbi:agmatine deiminase family protein [Zavarzinella formosa]|uniref:agmatine deiminase family protein n=1 Tax=Zavarzinella formosa TaxID=360055 RepID=UPI000374F508|nr:agmatine deiminase family protein [Zavarzinella formosa]